MRGAPGRTRLAAHDQHSADVPRRPAVYVHATPQKESTRGQSITTDGTRNPNLKAAVVCYGGASDTAAMASIRAPVFGVYAEDDARINSGIPAAEAAMERHGKVYRKTIYQGVGHAFLRRGPTEVAERAWSDVFAFLEEQVGR